MIYTRIIDGLAVVTYDDHDECYDFGEYGAAMLTREAALEAAQELIEIADQLLTDEQCDAIDALVEEGDRADHERTPMAGSHVPRRTGLRYLFGHP